MKTIAAFVAMAGLAAPALAGGPTAVVAEPTVVPVAEAPADPGIDWAGAYVGAQLGYADIDSNGADSDGDGAIGGVHAGYRWDFGTFVAGAEVDYDTADIDLGSAGDSLDDVARLKLMAGTEVGRSLVYGTLGAAYANATVADEDASDNGYFFGAGVDYAINDKWTVGGELLQHKFDDFDDSGVDIDATTFTAKVGFRF